MQQQHTNANNSLLRLHCPLISIPALEFGYCSNLSAIVDIKSNLFKSSITNSLFKAKASLVSSFHRLATRVEIPINIPQKHPFLRSVTIPAKSSPPSLAIEEPLHITQNNNTSSIESLKNISIYFINENNVCFNYTTPSEGVTLTLNKHHHDLCGHKMAVVCN